MNWGLAHEYTDSNWQNWDLDRSVMPNLCCVLGTPLEPLTSEAISSQGVTFSLVFSQDRLPFGTEGRKAALPPLMVADKSLLILLYLTKDFHLRYLICTPALRWRGW